MSIDKLIKENKAYYNNISSNNNTKNNISNTREVSRSAKSEHETKKDLIPLKAKSALLSDPATEYKNNNNIISFGSPKLQSLKQIKNKDKVNNINNINNQNLNKSLRANINKSNGLILDSNDNNSYVSNEDNHNSTNNDNNFNIFSNKNINMHTRKNDFNHINSNTNGNMGNLNNKKVNINFNFNFPAEDFKKLNIFSRDENSKFLNKKRLSIVDKKNNKNFNLNLNLNVNLNSSSQTHSQASHQLLNSTLENINSLSPNKAGSNYDLNSNDNNNFTNLPNGNNILEKARKIYNSNASKINNISRKSNFPELLSKKNKSTFQLNPNNICSKMDSFNLRNRSSTDLISDTFKNKYLGDNIYNNINNSNNLIYGDFSNNEINYKDKNTFGLINLNTENISTGEVTNQRLETINNTDNEIDFNILDVRKDKFYLNLYFFISGSENFFY